MTIYSNDKLILTNFLYLQKRPLSLLRKGSRSRRLWESPPIPSERYERRPCLCRVRCMCLSRIFLLFVKNGFVVGARTLNVTASHLLMARPRHSLSVTPSLHNSQCGSPTHTHTVYIELGGRRHADRQRGTGKQQRENGGWE